MSDAHAADFAAWEGTFPANPNWRPVLLELLDELQARQRRFGAFTTAAGGFAGGAVGAGLSYLQGMSALGVLALTVLLSLTSGAAVASLRRADCDLIRRTRATLAMDDFFTGGQQDCPELQAALMSQAEKILNDHRWVQEGRTRRTRRARRAILERGDH